eukprot:TRINITY_DN3445_c0_g1_i1.p1 TRINITY_DN3445_c0_g1~~TRINITY_DN3445_c0_g1_i1.p1  ORF type:complete len:119 (+),score=12.83 TRINITY_DN3445_c0_g1_i1:236-592(+)
MVHETSFGDVSVVLRELKIVIEGANTMMTYTERGGKWGGMVTYRRKAYAQTGGRSTTQKNAGEHPLVHQKTVYTPQKTSPKANAYTTSIDSSHKIHACLLYTSPSPRDRTRSRMPSSA